MITILIYTNCSHIKNLSSTAIKFPKKISTLQVDFILSILERISMKTNLKKINPHLVFLLIFLIIIAIIIFKIVAWNNSGIVLDGSTDLAEVPIETNDNFIPYTPPADYVDDGELNIAFFGNAPFYDDFGKSNNLVEMIGAKLNADVYNLSFENSYASSANNILTNDSYDLFSLYWLTTIYTVDNDVIVTKAKDAGLAMTLEQKSTLSLLQTLDFNQIDIVTIMYDASDYLAARGMYNRDDSQNITHFAGALEASINLIKQQFPHIQIIVMSPTYAYAVDEDGTYLDSTIVSFEDEGPLPSYVTYQAEAAYKSFASFVDNYYGSVNVLNADSYLADNIHLNQKGREIIADRFIEAYNHYDYYKNKSSN